MRIVISLVGVFLCSACTYSGKPATVSSAAAEIRTDRVVDRQVSVYVEPEIQDLIAEADTGYTCSAHAFPVEAGPAIVSSLRHVIEQSFTGYEFRESPAYTGDALDMRIAMDTFRVDLEFSSGFWTATAIASAELVLKVDVSDHGNPAISRTTVAGEGNGRKEGGCGEGAEASAEATEKAIKRTMENLVYKVINSGALAATAH